MDETRELAEAIYSMSEDMDWADYEDERDKTIASIMEELNLLPNSSVLLSCLRTIADLD